MEIIFILIAIVAIAGLVWWLKRPLTQVVVDDSSVEQVVEPVVEQPTTVVEQQVAIVDEAPVVIVSEPVKESVKFVPAKQKVAVSNTLKPQQAKKQVKSKQPVTQPVKANKKPSAASIKQASVKTSKKPAKK